MTVKYLVWIYMPTKTSYDVAGFTTSQISHDPTGLDKAPAGTEKDTLQILNQIRAHDSLAASIPSAFREAFTHGFLNYAMAANHQNNLGIAIRAYGEDTTLSNGVDVRNPKPFHQLATLTRRPIATC